MIGHFPARSHRVLDCLLPAFAADALALGPHWIYDREELDRLYPQGVGDYDAPRSPYHPGKQAGDQTHYGDQTLALLQSIVRHQGFDPEAWSRDWQSFWAGNPPAYRDGATRQTLTNLSAGLARPSDSHDLGGASRIPALLALDFAHDDEAIEAAILQTRLTHGDPRVHAAAGFFMLATRRILQGAYLPQAFSEAAARFPDGPPLVLAEKAALGPVSAMADLGISCDVAGASVITLALALKFEKSPAVALIENAHLGGDSAARGLILGLLLGTEHGISTCLHQNWIEKLRSRTQIEALLAS